MKVRALFSWKWLLPTILVLAGMVLLVRLGFWQLDRQEQKHAFNSMMAERWRAEPFDLNSESLPADLSALEYRRVVAQGEFDYERQILISNQVLQGGASGFMLVTPLVLDEDRAVLVSRGWVPADMGTAEQLALLTGAEGAGSVQFREPVLAAAQFNWWLVGGGALLVLLLIGFFGTRGAGLRGSPPSPKAPQAQRGASL